MRRFLTSVAVAVCLSGPAFGLDRINIPFQVTLDSDQSQVTEAVTVMGGVTADITVPNVAEPIVREGTRLVGMIAPGTEAGTLCVAWSNILLPSGEFGQIRTTQVCRPAEDMTAGAVLDMGLRPF